MKQRLLHLWCVVLIASHVLSQPAVFFTPTETEKFAKLYAQSQYVLGESSPQKIDDHSLYTYASHAYMQGQDPTQINFEHPPLAKYLYGVSLLLTGNVLWTSVLFSLGILWLLNALMIRLQIGWVGRLGALTLFGLQSPLHVQITMTLLDLPLLFFTLLFFSVLFRPYHKWQAVAVGLALGAIASIKYPFPGIMLPFGLAGLWYIRLRQFKSLFIVGAVSIFTYLCTYLVHFWHQPNPIHFLQFEWYRWKWWTGARTIPQFLILETLFTGSFSAWYDNGKKVVDSTWVWWWPVVFITHFLSLPILRRKTEYVLLFVYVQGLLVLYCLGSAVYARYLLQLVPIWLTLSILGINYWRKKIVHRHPPTPLVEKISRDV